MEIPFELYLDMPEEEKAFVQGFNYYIDETSKMQEESWQNLQAKFQKVSIC